MATEIEYTSLANLYLDPFNPRLGRSFQETLHSQADVYDEMRNWSLDELATSFLESGFWAHEAVLCCKETHENRPRLVVIEGNRRVAALKRLDMAHGGEERNRKWLDLIRNATVPQRLFTHVPYIRIPSREAVSSFVGFRHVTGIKEWAPPEKAEFIHNLIRKESLSYRDVMRRIGSKTPVVEMNYIAYCILIQMEDVEDLDVAEVQKRFSVLFLSLRSQKIRRFLGIEEKFGIDPNIVFPPVSEAHIDNLRRYALWLFGDHETSPIVKDSRQIERFAHVLGSDAGVEYLTTVRRPNLDTAFVIAGGSREEVYTLVATAAYNLQEALSSIHLYKDDDRLIEISKTLLAHTEQVKQTLGLVGS